MGGKRRSLRGAGVDIETTCDAQDQTEAQAKAARQGLEWRPLHSGLFVRVSELEAELSVIKPVIHDRESITNGDSVIGRLRVAVKL